MDSPLNVLALGAGVQSSTLLLMSCKGILPKLTAAVFADTQWEPAQVYRNLDFLTEEANRVGIPIHCVSVGNLREMVLRAKSNGREGRYVSIPLYLRNRDGTRGRLRRQCTRDFKGRPIERCLRRQILGLRPRQRSPRTLVIRQWLGISADEASRAKECPDVWREYTYPLLGLPRDYLPSPMTRDDCHTWLAEHYPGREFPRSACIGCPFRNDQEWEDMKTHRYNEFTDALEVDMVLRFQDGLDGTAYIHDSRRPLIEAPFSRTDQSPNRWDNECTGLCGA